VKIDVYRSCTWREKRDVLNVFWRTNVEGSSRIIEASVQYGYYAIICLVVVMVEVAFILGVSLDRNALIAALTVLAELFMIWSTWWAMKRYRVLKYQFVSDLPRTN
jgi:membrane protein YdbS with pleckstrin-like domain